MFSGIKSDSAENLLHKPTIIPALLLKYFTDVFVAWKSDVYCSHFTGSKTGVEGLVSHHASGASVPVGSREGLSLTVKVNRGEKKTTVPVVLLLCWVYLLLQVLHKVEGLCCDAAKLGGSQTV